ncbi:MAG: CxxxxCH/CxxCH domain-containing protein [Thermoplasmata archaeon]|nr:MAG: CxxxxCH/CxxCH domain-containing protein [Thermoplasmata archaeon]
MNLKQKLLLLMLLSLIAIIVGIISTESLFKNQHVFEDTNTLDCERCHEDIWNEINSDSTMPHYQKNCTDCHQHTSVFTAGKEHAAVGAIECQACHSNSVRESGSPGGTEGFNYSTNEAHRLLYDYALTDSLMAGANEACVACHTRYDLSITYKKPNFREFYVDYGTQTFDGGYLNSTPDRLVVPGSANITNFVNADDIYWRDVNGDSDWDPNEDIFRDEGSGTYDAADTVLYVGNNSKDSYGSAVEFGTDQEIFYLDSDHDGQYDYSTGTEEPLFYVGIDGGSVADNSTLLSTHVALSPYDGIIWVTDAILLSNTNYYFLDNATGTPGTYDPGEPIILDNGDGIIERGILNGAGSPDIVITSGYPDLRSFVASDKVTFNDTNSDSTWNVNEDIVFDSDDDNLFDYYGSIFDYTLYQGASFDVSHGGILTDMSSNLKYIDSDHSGNYTLGEPIVISANLILESTDEILLRNDDIYNNGSKTFGLWDFDLNRFTAEFYIDNNNNGIYDDGEAIIRETYRIYNLTFTGEKTTSIIITESTSSAGLHVYRSGSKIWDVGTGESFCGDSNLGCHQDVFYSINDNFGGGHYTNSTLSGHLESSECSFCHRNSKQIDPDNDHYDSINGSWHSAKRVSCAFEDGCHSTMFQGGLMQEVFEEIEQVNLSYRGDICWSCHRGDFDWSDPTGKIFRVYVEDDSAYQQVMIDSATVYAPTNYANCVCHDDTLANVPNVPWGSGKYVDHSTASANNYDQCTKCHLEWADPHNDSHSIDMDWSQWEFENLGIPSGFCNTTCHYSVNDARPKYIDTNTTWMTIEYSNWINNGARHTYSAVLGGDGSTVGSVNCTICHNTHSTVPSCDRSGCHLDSGAISNKRDVPSSHATTPGIINSDRFPCGRSLCHNGGAHDPQPPGCHGTGGDGGCEPNTNAHPKHIDSSYYYDFLCTECHYDSGVGYNGGQGTFGGSLHNNGAVNVGFDSTTNGNATFGGVLTGVNAPSYAGSGGSCDNTYCHSNGYNISSSGVTSGYLSFTTPGWNSSTSSACGMCHGAPNYYNGTAWRELGGSETSNSPTHLKHTKNYGGIYATRYLYWVDATPSGSQTPPYGWVDSIYDPGEAVIQDLNNNRMLDYGVLNGGNDQSANPPQSPDKVLVNGTADLTDFVSADGVWFWDANTDSNWDRDEDIYVETGGGGNAADEYNPGKGDYLIYIGTSQDITADDNTNTVDLTTDTSDPVMYLDSDHDNVYDNWYNSGLTTYSGVEEPLIYVQSNKATGANLDSSDEVLNNTAQYLYYYVDFNRWYSFDCSECHYNNAPTSGYGTYGTSKHVDMSKDIAFDWTTNGIASKKGVYGTQVNASGSWDPVASTCYGIWCHSDAFERDDTDQSPAGNGLPDWSGTGIYDDSANYDYHTVKPNWTDKSRTTVFCGSCHYSWDKPGNVSGTIDDRPNTGAHRKISQHTGASQFGWHSDSDAALCMECHWRYDTYGGSNQNQWWRPYGSPQHVDASVWIWPASTPDGAGLFGPLSESQGYTSGCHNTWPGNWQAGYPGGC